MRTSSRSFGIRVLPLLAAALLLGTSPSAAQDNHGSSVREALDEVLTVLPGMSCADPEVWTVEGDSEVAARSLVEKLAERGWDILEHGSTSRGYAVIADPDPRDPSAYAIGGLLFESVGDNASAAYITRCTRNVIEDRADPSWFT